MYEVIISYTIKKLYITFYNIIKNILIYKTTEDVKHTLIYIATTEKL